jgi:hypothetical protein
MSRKVSNLFLVLALFTLIGLPSLAAAQVTHTIVVHQWDPVLQLWTMPDNVDVHFVVRWTNRGWDEWEWDTFVNTVDGVATTDILEHSTSTYWVAFIDPPAGFIFMPDEGEVYYPAHVIHFWLQPE